MRANRPQPWADTPKGRRALIIVRALAVYTIMVLACLGTYALLIALIRHLL